MTTTQSKSHSEKSVPQKQRCNTEEKTIDALMDSDEEPVPQKKKLQKRTSKPKETDINPTSRKKKQNQKKNPKNTKNSSATIPLPRTELSAKSTDTSSPSPHKKRKLVFDGLSESDLDCDVSSEKEDDSFMEKVTSESASRKSKTKSPRITIKIPKDQKFRKRKCHCKRGCNHLCGCKKNNNKCGISCACHGECNNV